MTLLTSSSFQAVCKYREMADCEAFASLSWNAQQGLRWEAVMVKPESFAEIQVGATLCGICRLAPTLNRRTFSDITS